MKKVLLFFLSFFISLPSVFALGKIESINTTVTIDAKGDATVVEKWEVNKQDFNYFEKNFYDVENITISDILVEDANKSNYHSVDKWDANTPFTYYLKDSGKNKSLLLSTNKGKNTFTITYKVSGMISSFNDAVGINWYFLPKIGKHSIGRLDITIKGPVNFNESNVALYIIGKDIAPSFKDGTIQLFASNLTNNHQLKLMTTFTDMNFEKTTKIDSTFEEAYEKAKKGTTLLEDIRMYITDEVIKIVLIVVGLIIVIVVAAKVYNALRVHDEYYCIDTINNITIPKMDEVDYFENTPCNGDLYKIAFIAGYFKILKNRSDLVGALILKMVFENRATISEGKNKPRLP
ncbi:MAG: DUF2207 domain-containing protein [Bacilli bacterium]|nr:DUF2207 domain-containing protein [Bacilli bacterium]